MISLSACAPMIVPMLMLMLMFMTMLILIPVSYTHLTLPTILLV